MSASELFLIIFLLAVGCFLIGFFAPVMAVIAGISALVAAALKIARQ